MTIRRNINIEQARDDLEAFREGIDSAPDGMYTRAREIKRVIDRTFATLFEEAHSINLNVDNADGSMEVEIVLFAMLQRANHLDADIHAAISLGRTLLDYPESRERVLAGLTRDRDSLREIRDRASERVAGVDDGTEEMPV